MDSPHTNGSDWDAIDPAGVLGQVKSYLDAFDTWEDDRATEEDLIIVECLLQAVHAARRKGYSDELLVQVLRSLIQTPPSP